MQNPENMREGARSVREELNKLRQEVDSKVDTETPDERRQRIEGQITTLLPFVQQLHTQRVELEKNGGKDSKSFAEELKNVESHLLAEAVSQDTIGGEDLLRGLLESDGEDTSDINQLIEQLNSPQMNDEIDALTNFVIKPKGLQGTIMNFMNKIPGLDSMLEKFGMSREQVAEFVTGYAYSMLETMPGGGGYVMKSRESDGLVRAEREFMSKDAIKKGRETWQKEYGEWMKKGSEAGPAPDLYMHIVAAQETVKTEQETAQATEAEKKAMEKLQTAVDAASPLGADVKITVVNDGEKSAKRSGTEWVATMSKSEFNEDGTLKDDKFKNAFDALKSAPEIGQISFGTSWEVKKTSDGSLDVRADATLDAAKIVAIGELKPENQVKSVALMTEGVGQGSGKPFARFEAGKLLVNDAVMTTSNVRKELIKETKDIPDGNASKKYQFDNGKWEEYTA